MAEPAAAGGVRLTGGEWERQSLFRQRDFVLLWAGQSVSELGSSVGQVAIPLVAVLVLHASAFEVGMVTAASSAAWLVVGLPAGVWVDRLPRRPLLVGADVGRGVLLVTVPVAWSVGALSVGLLVAVAFGVGLLSVLFNVGYPAYLPSIVDRQRLVEGNGALLASDAATGVVGPSLGGALVGLVGAPVAVLADAASFLVSAVSLAAIRASESRPQRPRVRRRLGQEIGAGLRYAASHPLTRSLVPASTLANFVLGGFQAVVVVFLARQVGLSPALIGVLFALAGLGGVFGAVVAAPLARRVGSARVMWGALVAMAACGLLVPLTGTGARAAWYVAGALPLSLGATAYAVCMRAAVQAAAPDEIRGRLTATIRLAGRTGWMSGALSAGALAGLTSPRAALVVLMALLVLAPVRLVLSPVGRVRDVAELTPAGG